VQRPRFNAALAATCAILIAGLSACQSGSSRASILPELSPRQRESMQTRILDVDYDIAYASVISILQDEGWRISEVDKASGLIQASSLKYQDEVGPREDALRNDKDFRKVLKQQRKKGQSPVWTRWRELTARVEPWGTGKTRVRITIVKLGSISPYEG